jgi:hypothetical protein
LTEARTATDVIIMVIDELAKAKLGAKMIAAAVAALIMAVGVSLKEPLRPRRPMW